MSYSCGSSRMTVGSSQEGPRGPVLAADTCIANPMFTWERTGYVMRLRWGRFRLGIRERFCMLLVGPFHDSVNSLHDNRLSIWPPQPLFRCKVGLRKLTSGDGRSNSHLFTLCLLSQSPLHHGPVCQYGHQNEQLLWRHHGHSLCRWDRAAMRSWELQASLT